MKNIRNIFPPLFFVLVGVVFSAGCSDSTSPESSVCPAIPVRISIAGMEPSSSTMTLEAVYDKNNGIELSGSPSQTYEITLDSPCPEDVVVSVKPLVVNIPREKVRISDTKVMIPAGSLTALVDVDLVDNDFGFAKFDSPAQRYELGLRISGVVGYNTSLESDEAKVIIEKEAYRTPVFLSLTSDVGRRIKIICRYSDGKIIDGISSTFRACLDIPAPNDVTVHFSTSGMEPEFADDAVFSPAFVVIPAGELTSSEVTWSVTNDFLEVNDYEEQYRFVLSSSAQTEATNVRLAPDGASMLTVDIEKQLYSENQSTVEVVSDMDASWSLYTRTGWIARYNNGSAAAILDGKSSSITTNSNNLWASVDMEEEREVAGIGLEYFFGMPAYSPSDIEVSVSADGENWKSVGAVEITRTGKQYLKLTHTSTRYIKVDLSVQNADPIKLSELKVFGSK